MDRVARGCGWQLGWEVIVLIVPIVTNTDFKLHWVIARVHHVGWKECSKKLVLSLAKKWCEPLQIKYTDVLRVNHWWLAQSHSHLYHYTPTVGHTFRLEWNFRMQNWLKTYIIGKLSREKSFANLLETSIMLTKLSWFESENLQRKLLRIAPKPTTKSAKVFSLKMFLLYGI